MPENSPQVGKGDLLNGASKSSVERLNKMDVIASDKRLTEIYLAIVKEMAIKHNVSFKQQEDV